MHWSGPLLGAAAGVIATGLQAQDDLQRCVWACLAEFGPNTNPAYHQCVADRCAAGSAGGEPAGGPWAFIDPLMAQSLDIRPGESGAIFFPDHADPSVATMGIGFHYFESRTGGNAVGLNVGLFRRGPGGWAYAGPVDGLFGIDPRDPAFPPVGIEITTMTLGPNDARCCPTAEARWSVDRTTRAVRRLK